MDWDVLQSLREQWRLGSRKVVWTNGCFDLLHLGHVHSLQAARDLGDVLIVGVNGDRSVRALKGPTRPIIPAEERAEVVASLRCVDYALIFDEPTPEAAIGRLRPDICCKGADYSPGSGKPVPEAAIVESYGGRMVFLPLLRSLSTSEMIRRIRAIEEPSGRS